MKIKFWKMSGAGNDFVLITGRKRSAAALKKLAVRLCAHKNGIGADGLLLVNKEGKGAVSMRYFNSDGSEAFCGNGSRCSAWWAYSNGLMKKKKFELRTISGILPVEIKSRGSVKMRMPDVKGASLAHKGAYPAGIGAVHFLNTGVPHAVTVCRDIRNVDVFRLGRALRYNRTFGPKGTNVDFVSLGKTVVCVRTYERGVENETLACGTGITASAVAMVLAGKAVSPVTLEARSGERFRVWLNPCEAGAKDIYIQGPAETVFSGEMNI